MLRQRYVGLLACAVLPLLGGCMQATRHSNTMVFGTNTTVGVKVGRDVNQMPNVMIAYDRQEAVIMPLLANTGEKGSRWNMLSPCSVEEQTTKSSTNSDGVTTALTKGGTDTINFGAQNSAQVHPCKFVGVRAVSGGVFVQDSYSVLASFGAKLKGNATGNEAAAGLAQYFATGVAAQLLAASGGAAVVSVSDAAERSAESTTSSNAAAAVLGAQTYPPGTGKRADEARTSLRARIAGLTDAETQQAMPAFIDSLSISARQKTRFKQACQTKDSCIAFIDGNGQLIEGVTLDDVGKI